MGTKIEWADEVWNPVTGCTKVSSGCTNCYAERMAKRLAANQSVYCFYKYEDFKVATWKDRLHQPLHWIKPRRVFVCSMSDLFHDDVPMEFIGRVFKIVAACPQHTFQILTKRPKRMKELCGFWWGWEFERGHVDNAWLGVTAENQECADERIPLLLQTPAAVRFVSVEPMLGPVDLQNIMTIGESLYHCQICDGSGIDPGGLLGITQGGICPECSGIPPLDWIIFGCESGPNRRKMRLEWLRNGLAQCRDAGIPAFVKQIHVNGKVSKNPDEWPEELRVREYPQQRMVT